MFEGLNSLAKTTDLWTNNGPSVRRQAGLSPLNFELTLIVWVSP
jgi:hypothetical protein